MDTLPTTDQNGPTVPPPTTALVIGMGSIGHRHAEVLTELGVNTFTLSRRSGADFGSLEDALRDKPSLNYVVVATETSAHHEALRSLAASSFSGITLVEKPVVGSPAEHIPGENTFVGYNLRFHPLIAAARDFCNTTGVLSIEIHAGQDLREWRSGRDFRTSYSASQDSGGGVLRDLSHELDYLLWMAGPWKRVIGAGGSFSSLGIDSDDLWHIVIEMESGQICSVSVNYLDTPARRVVHLTGDQGSFTADLIAGTVSRGDRVDTFESTRNMTYNAMHGALIDGATDRRLCSFDEGMAVVGLIDAIERSQREESWIYR